VPCRTSGTRVCTHSSRFYTRVYMITCSGPRGRYYTAVITTCTLTQNLVTWLHIYIYTLNPALPGRFAAHPLEVTSTSRTRMPARSTSSSRGYSMRHGLRLALDLLQHRANLPRGSVFSDFSAIPYYIIMYVLTILSPQQKPKDASLSNCGYRLHACTQRRGAASKEGDEHAQADPC
jgi:hypothetical protein